MREAAALAAANAALATRSRLLNVIAEESRTLLLAGDLYEAIGQTMARVGEAAGLSRVVYLEERPRVADPPGARDHHVRVEWCAPGIPDHATLDATSLPGETFAAFLAPARRGESMWWRTEDLDPAARSALARMGILATGYAPVFVDGGYIGIVAFSDCAEARTWDAAHVDGLTAAANAIGAALQGEHLRAGLLRERERASQARAIEVDKASEVLRRAADGLVATADLGSALSVFLREAAAVVGARDALVLRRVGAGTRFEVVAVLDGHTTNGTVLTGDALRDHPAAAVLPDATERDVTGRFAALVAGHAMRWRVEDVARVVPNSAACAHVRGANVLWSVPFALGGTVVGYLSFVLCDDREPDEFVQQAVAALGRQIAVALQLTRTAEEAQQTAAAHERERAAQERAAGLGRANTALRDSLRRLVGPDDLSAFLGHAVAVAAEQAGAVRADLFRYDPAHHIVRQVLAVVGGTVYAHGYPGDPPEFRTGIPTLDAEEWPHLVLGSTPALHFVTLPDARCSRFVVDWHRRMAHTGLGILALVGANGARRSPASCTIRSRRDLPRS